MSFQTGATSQSIDVRIYDDSGLPVPGLVAASFPALTWSRAGANADVAFPALSDLALITSAWVSGGVKERGGGVYRLDCPDAIFAVEGSVRLRGEETGKHLISELLESSGLKSLITKFSGITSVANWLGILAGKTADATTRAEVNATTAGASYLETTDSLQAIRDRGDLSWSAASSIIVAPVSSYLEDRVRSSIIEAYYAEDGWTIGPLVLTQADGTALNLTAYIGTLKFIVENRHGVDIFETDTITVTGASSNQVSLTGTSALTGTTGRDMIWSLRSIDTGFNLLLATGQFVVKNAANAD